MQNYFLFHCLNHHFFKVEHHKENNLPKYNHLRTFLNKVKTKVNLYE